MRPDDPFFLISHHFWIALIVVSFINAIIYRGRIKARFSENKKLQAHADQLLWGFLFWGNLPWLLMGYGIETGKVEAVPEYLYAAQSNSFIQFWYGAMAALLALGSGWVLMAGGAESISRIAIEFNSMWTAKLIRWAWVGLVLWNLIIGSAMYYDFMGFGHGRNLGQGQAEAPGFMAFFPVFFVVMWCGVSLMLSFMGGWWALAKEYRAQQAFEGERYRFQSGKMGGTSYGSCLVLGAGEQGFYMTVLPFFRLGHPPVLIPWDEIEVSEETVMMFFKRVVFRFKRAPKLRFAVSRRLVLKLSGNSWARETFRNIK